MTFTSSVWTPGAAFRYRSERSAPGEANDPALVRIDLSPRSIRVRAQAGLRHWARRRRLAPGIGNRLLYEDETVPLTGARISRCLRGAGCGSAMNMGTRHGCPRSARRAWLVL